MKLTLALASSAVVLASSLTVSAHVGRGFAVPEPQHYLKSRSGHVHGRSRMMARANPSSDADMAKINDASQECQSYGLPSSQKLTSVYPKAGQIADIVKGDDDGGRMFEEILKSNVIPANIQPRGSVQQNMGISQQATSSYNIQQDPDCWWTATGCTKPKGQNLDADLSTCPEPKTWGLTFDDGPNCSHNAFYDYLQQNNLKATLFYIGTNVVDWPLQAQRGLSDGHDICVHTWSHHYMTTLTNSQVFSELYYTMRIIKDVTGVTARCWRPPFGDVDNRVRSIASALGLRTIIWDHDTDDWNIQPEGSAPTQQINSNYDNIIKMGQNGTANDHGVVVLTHELTNETMSEFISKFPEIKKAYEHIVPLTACFNATQPYVENQPTYPNFADFTSGKINPQGLPDPSNMQINVKSAINIQSTKNQTKVGGFSPASVKKAANGGKSSGASASGQSSAGASPSGGAESGSDGSDNSSNSPSGADSDSSANDTQNKGSAKSGAMAMASAPLSLALSLSILLPLTLSI